MAKTVKNSPNSAQPKQKLRTVAVAVKTKKEAVVKKPKIELTPASPTSDFKWPKGELEETRDLLNSLEVRGIPIQGAMQRVQAKQRDMYSVPIDSLQIKSEFNIRLQDQDYQNRIETLAESMLKHGFMKDRPITVMCIEQGGEPVLFVVDGHTRLLAAKLAITRGAKLDLLPVVAKPMGTTQEELLLSLHTSNTGTQLKPIELGKLLKRMHACTEEPVGVLAKMFTVSEAYAEKCMALAGLPMVVRKMLINSTISAATALEVNRVISDPQEQIKATKEAVAIAESRGSKVVKPKDYPVLVANNKKLLHFTSTIKFLVNKEELHGDTVPIDVLYELAALSFNKPIAEILKQCKASAEVDSANCTVVSRALAGTNKKSPRQLPLEGVAA
jgi:ParB-like chromosome segregation protein Spo0J